MVPIPRYEPGELALYAGTYAVVGHYGEPTGVAMWCEVGERLPLVLSADVEPPLWYVTVGISAVTAQAA